MITSVRDLVRALGGPSAVAERCDISPSAVTNWYARDSVSADHRLTVWHMASELGVEWTPPGAEGLAIVPREAA